MFQTTPVFESHAIATNHHLISINRNCIILLVQLVKQNISNLQINSSQPSSYYLPQL